MEAESAEQDVELEPEEPEDEGEREEDVELALEEREDEGEREEELVCPCWGVAVWETIRCASAASGHVCGSGEMTTGLPGLNVEGVGPVGLPLVGAQVDAVKALCCKAPYGRGSATILDTSVRSTWQLEPGQFTLTNPNWDSTMESILPEVKRQLGLPEDAGVRADLYKLLLYEQGGFFKRHRDTEKAAGMFATLVILLPSIFEGGQLVVTHDGHRTEIDLAAKSQYHFHFLVFYADCEHEILPVTSGNRLALVYNLISTSSGAPPEAVSNAHAVQTIADKLRSWLPCATEEAAMELPEKLVFILSHQYSRAGLSFDRLKNGDRAMAELLRQVIRSPYLATSSKRQFDLYLATIHVKESGTGDEGWRAGDKLSVDRRDITLKRWVSGEDNTRRLLGKVRVDDDNDNCEEVFPRKLLEETDWDEVEVGGPAGNEGATVERWYRRAALVLWPRSGWIDRLVTSMSGDAARVLANNLRQRQLKTKRRAEGAVVEQPQSKKRRKKEGPNQARTRKGKEEEEEEEDNKELEEDKAQGEAAEGKELEIRALSMKQCSRFARALIGTGRWNRLYGQYQRGWVIMSLGSSLVQLKDVELSRQFVNQVVKTYSPSPNQYGVSWEEGALDDQLVEGLFRTVKASRWDEQMCKSVLELLQKHVGLAAQGHTDLAHAIGLLVAFVFGVNYGPAANLGLPLASAGRKALCQQLMETFLSSLAAESDLIRDDPEENTVLYAKRPRTEKFVCYVFACLLRLNEPRAAERVALVMIARPQRYPVLDCLCGALDQLMGWLESARSNTRQRANQPDTQEASLLAHGMPRDPAWLVTLIDHCIAVLVGQLDTAPGSVVGRVQAALATLRLLQEKLKQ